jgi:hypothetical protein
MTGDLDNHDAFGLEGIMKNYALTLKNVELNGPTYFGPVLRVASNQARKLKEENNDTYIVLLILTDGEVHDMEVCKALLVDAARIPLSVIIVGIGNADFTKMEILDGDDGLVDAKGRSADRDLVQFVPFNEFRNNPMLLAEEVLEELPDQLVIYKQMVSEMPGEPKIRDIKDLGFDPPEEPPPAPKIETARKESGRSSAASDNTLNGLQSAKSPAGPSLFFPGKLK